MSEQIRFEAAETASRYWNNPEPTGKPHLWGEMNENDACSVTCIDCKLPHYWWEGPNANEPECKPEKKVIEKWRSVGRFEFRYFCYDDE